MGEKYRILPFPFEKIHYSIIILMFMAISASFSLICTFLKILAQIIYCAELVSGKNSLTGNGCKEVQFSALVIALQTSTI